jgi:hypothetical protein
MSPQAIALQRWLHLLGSLLAIAGVVFMAFRIRDYWGSLDPVLLNSANIGQVAALSILYTVGNLLLALAWIRLLRHLGSEANHRSCIGVYGLTQLAKYIPGNIFHLAGRQAMGMAAGLRAGILAKSTFWELGLIAFSGALFSILILPIFWPEISAHSTAVLWCVCIAFILSSMWIYQGSDLAAAFLFQILFLALSGFIFIVLINGLGKETSSALPAWSIGLGAYIVAWLIGLVTPGAPAGVGIREMVLIFLLGHAIPEAVLLPAILFSRIVSVAGDVTFCLATILYCRAVPANSTKPDSSNHLTNNAQH